MSALDQVGVAAIVVSAIAGVLVAWIESRRNVVDVDILVRVVALEERVATLSAEVDRLRAGPSGGP